MNWVRSVLFSALLVMWTLGLALALLVLPRRGRRGGQRAGVVWSRGILALARYVCGIRYVIVGREYFESGPMLIAAKHQSAWDTLIFHQLLSDPVFVMKQELLRLPLVGSILRQAGNIPIDRGAGVKALRTMLPAAQARLAEGAQIIIFPEGTRTEPGERRTYQPGVAALYERLGVPVIPVALNSGLFWRAHGILKRPGTITLEALPPIPPGLDRKAFQALLQERIEVATDRLVALGR